MKLTREEQTNAIQGLKEQIELAQTIIQNLSNLIVSIEAVIPEDAEQPPIPSIAELESKITELYVWLKEDNRPADEIEAIKREIEYINKWIEQYPTKP